MTPPTYRFDIAIEEDLIEEIARIHGYDRIPATTPSAPAVLLPVPEARRDAATLRSMLVDRDYQEIVSYSFVDESWERDLGGNSSPVALANPIASQMSVMRSTLSGGARQCARFQREPPAGAGAIVRDRALFPRGAGRRVSAADPRGRTCLRRRLPRAVGERPATASISTT